MSLLKVFEWIFEPKLKPGRQVFAIGDVHGLSGSLMAMLDAMAGKAGEDSALVILGDLIDRGPDSLGAIKAVAEEKRANRFKDVFWLLGNHDIFILGALAGVKPIVANWEQNGMERTLNSIDYAIPNPIEYPECLREELLKRMSQEDLDAYCSALTHQEIGNLLLIHAGINPSIPFEDHFTGGPLSPRYLYGREDESHFAWVREPFIYHDGEFEGGRFVVHGHTQEAYTRLSKGIRNKLNDQTHYVDGWRLGLDGTGNMDKAVAGAEIQDGRYRIFLASYRLTD